MLTVYKNDNNWIRTADLWCKKQLLYKLSNNHHL